MPETTETTETGRWPELPHNDNLWRELPWPAGMDTSDDADHPTAEQVKAAYDAATDEQRLDLLRGVVFDHWALGVFMQELGADVMANLLAGDIARLAASSSPSIASNGDTLPGA